MKEEANRKYGNLLESIPTRLEQIVAKPVEEEDVADDAAAEGGEN